MTRIEFLVMYKECYPDEDFSVGVFHCKARLCDNCSLINECKVFRTKGLINELDDNNIQELKNIIPEHFI